ncbi:MAG: GGDEF domain-containing protein [Myxococcota bacterium]
MGSTAEKVSDALAQVQTLIEEIVRHEQLRDVLTGLPNDAALTAELIRAVESNEDFWCAFVEIDHFKRLNDNFGYQRADGMLLKVAKQLEMARDYFPEGATAFRAHGDEFFMVGRLGSDDTPDTIASSLDRLRGAIGALRLRAGDGVMSCTVSVGWLSSTVVEPEDGTPRGLRIALEAAVALAKQKGRNRVVEFSDEARKKQVRTVRDNCSECHVAFTVDLLDANPREDDLWCPNCGTRCPRPPAPRPSASIAV